MAEVKAKLNRLRMAPRKVRSVVKLVKGRSVDNAISQLEFAGKRASWLLIKLINSAIASAENNFNMIRSNLFIKDFRVDEGIKLKRYMARAMGRAMEIQKKTSHIILILGEKVPGLKAEARREKRSGRPEIVEGEKAEKQKIVEKKPEIKTEIGKKLEGPRRGLKRFFQRKAV